MSTFLSRLGKVLATVVNIASVAAGIGPILQGFLGSNTKVGAVVGTAVNDLTAIGQTVLSAEAMIQAPGSGVQKLAAATPLVSQIVQTSELVAGHKIANEALFIQGSQKITSGVADILNSLHPDGVPNPSPAPTLEPLPTLPTPTVLPSA
jgi:hypothetical protein